ncbi:MAG TPA: hypothetical protein VGO71_05445 [Baekduia sp.]|jgi:hypothetical protein|nr:hypothetical protein [Baekduia sp.]
MRILRFAVVLVIAALVGVAGASAVVGDTGKDTINGPTAVQPDGSGAALVASAADPNGHQPWAIRVYRSVDGWTCPEAGRTQDGDFGQVDADGKFRSNSIQAAGSCVDLDKAPMSVTVNHYPANGLRGARAVVFGVVSPSVKSVSVQLAGRMRPLALANGAFMAVASESDLEGASVEATMQDGSAKSYPLAPTDEPATEGPVGP